MNSASSVASINCSSLSFIHESLYAPQCPEEAALLFDAALTLQNDGQYAFAINAVMDAQKAWEHQLLNENYPNIEDKVAHSILLKLHMADRAAAEEEQRILMEEKLLEEKKRLSGASLRTTESHISDINDDNLKTQENTASRNAEEDKRIAERKEQENAQRQFEEEREAKRQEKIQAIHHCYQLIPTVGNVFIQLRLSSIYQSSGADERALVTSLYALKFCQTVPKYTCSLLTATVYHTIGNYIFSPSQLDYASDYFFKTLEIRELALGVGHVETATVLHNIGCVLHLLGKSSDSLVMLYQALRTFEYTLPPHHPRIETCEANIRKVRSLSQSPPIVPSKVPFTTNELIPVIPGAKRAKQFYAVQPKKKDDKGKKNIRL